MVEQDSELAELRVLAALCQAHGETGLRRRARELLAGYPWSGGARRAVFEIVTSIPFATPEALRELLPARLTRRGYPDFDFDAVFDTPVPTDSEAEELMRRLA